VLLTLSYGDIAILPEIMVREIMNIKESELWVGGIEGLRNNYLNLLGDVKREGMDQFIQWLVHTDFFEAPASANGHDNYEGGLVEHSLKVYQILVNLVGVKREVYPSTNPETLTLVALTHDICKANFYKASWKNQKRIDENGKDVLDGRDKPIWDRVPYFTIEDQCPLGHGEKSVIVLQRFMRLTDEEIFAIRWHMGGFDDAARSYAGGLALGNAIQKYPLIAFLHCADLLATLPDKEEVPYG
jgi:hypothetical protein